jgi:hypothetical protein
MCFFTLGPPENRRTGTCFRYRILGCDFNCKATSQCNHKKNNLFDNSRAAAVRDDAVAVAARAQWPADVPDVVSFASLKAAAAAAGGTSTTNASATAAANTVSVVGAVHARDPPAGTKVVTNPKTQRAYDMLFITLGDHTGARIRAQLIGRPAKRAAAALDAERGGGRGGGETASRTTPFAWCTPFLKDFSRRHSSPALPFQRKFDR